MSPAAGGEISMPRRKSDDPWGVRQSKDALNRCIRMLDEKDRMHRKIQFLLDVRGLLVINKMEGDYAEFGVYRGEMMYAAARILGKRIRRFIGLDTFEGLPNPTPRDEQIFVFEEKGFMASRKSTAREMMLGFPAVLIEGDFRAPRVQAQFRKSKPALAVLSVDCNWPSSVAAALRLSAPYLQAGSIVYMDDYFVGTRHKNFNTALMRRMERAGRMRFIEFKTYAPCGRAFLIEKDGA
jgi:hypothetical protein